MTGVYGDSDDRRGTDSESDDWAPPDDSNQRMCLRYRDSKLERAGGGPRRGERGRQTDRQTDRKTETDRTRQR